MRFNIYLRVLSSSRPYQALQYIHPLIVFKSVPGSDVQRPTIRKCARVKSQMRPVHFLTKCFPTINNQHPPTNVQQSENALCAVLGVQSVFNVCNSQQSTTQCATIVCSFQQAPSVQHCATRCFQLCNKSVPAARPVSSTTSLTRDQGAEKLHKLVKCFTIIKM